MDAGRRAVLRDDGRSRCCGVRGGGGGGGITISSGGDALRGVFGWGGGGDGGGFAGFGTAAANDVRAGMISSC